MGDFFFSFLKFQFKCSNCKFLRLYTHFALLDEVQEKNLWSQEDLSFNNVIQKMYFLGARRTRPDFTYNLTKKRHFFAKL